MRTAGQTDAESCAFIRGNKYDCAVYLVHSVRFQCPCSVQSFNWIGTVRTLLVEAMRYFSPAAERRSTPAPPVAADVELCSQKAPPCLVTNEFGIRVDFRWVYNALSNFRGMLHTNLRCRKHIERHTSVTKVVDTMYLVHNFTALCEYNQRRYSMERLPN